MAHIIVVGGGPGGTSAATRASQLGASVTLIEQEYLGGACVNYNCIPFTGMLASAEALDRIRQAGNLGVEVGEAKLNLVKAREHVMGVVEELRMGIGALMGSFGVEVIEGTAKLVGPKNVMVGDKKLQGDAIILATGARAVKPPVAIEGMLTMREALALDVPPASLLVYGGDVYEVQFAQFFAILGSKVTLVTPESSILPDEDYEVSQRLKSILGEYGVQVLSGATLKSTARQGSQVSAVISQRKGESTVVVDRILWSAFAPAIEGLGLESAGVKVMDGAVKVDNRCQTNVPSIYAIGDLTGKPMYSHVATVQGLVAAENALGKNRRIDLRLSPRCIYTIPEAACVGLTETEAEDQGYDVQIVNISQQTSVRAMTREEAVGGVKVVFDRKTSKILGVHIVGYRATDLIGEAALALQLEVLADDFAWALRGHPTLCESMVEAGRAFYKQALYIPKM